MEMMERCTMRLIEVVERLLNEEELAWLAKTVEAGGLLVYPTETLYGIGCDPMNQAAVKRLFETKERPISGEVSIAFDSLETVKGWVDVPEQGLEILKAYAPGPLTLLIPRPRELKLGLPASNKLGIRIPSHSICRQLLEAAGPLISTSANRHGQPPSTKEAEKIAEQCEAFITSGGLGGEGSTIISLDEERSEPGNWKTKILRQGPLHLDL